jgi:tetratricopeptide (TPR) repeat protein
MTMISRATSGLVVALLLLIGLSVTAQIAVPSMQARDNINKGVSAFRNADYESAVEFFKQALQVDPGLMVAELYLATAYAQRFVPGVETRENLTFADNAIVSYKRVLQQDPNNATALLGLASLYQNSNDLQNARQTFLMASRVVSLDPVAFYAVGAVDWMLVYQRTNPLGVVEQSRLIEEGLDNLDSALALNPIYDDAMTYKNLLLREKARLASDPAEKARLITLADEWFNRALETRKRNADIRRGAGRVPASPLRPH